LDVTGPHRNNQIMDHVRHPRFLRRTEPAKNMARFYALSIEPSLFGELLLIRHWGRIGSHGRLMIEAFPTSDAATAALSKLADRKHKRGYVEHR
jgi:predicted DNA-binding WGR domain protein